MRKINNIPNYIFCIFIIVFYISSIFIPSNILKLIFILPILFYIPGLCIIKILKLKSLRRYTQEILKIIFSMISIIIILWLYYLIFRTTNYMLYIAYSLPFFFSIILFILDYKNSIQYLKFNTMFEFFKALKISKKHIITLILLSLITTALVITFTKKARYISFYFTNQIDNYSVGSNPDYLLFDLSVDISGYNIEQAEIQWICGNTSSEDIEIINTHNQYILQLFIEDLSELVIEFNLILESQVSRSINSINPYYT